MLYLIYEIYEVFYIWHALRNNIDSETIRGKGE